MAKLSADDVAKIAKLAKLDLTEKEIEKYAPQLSPVIDYFGELSEVDTDNTEPTSQTTGLLNKTRKDETNVMQTLKVDDALSGTEKTHNGYIVVPPILEK